MEAASKLIASGALRGADLRHAREQGLRKNSDRVSDIQHERNRMIGVFKSFDTDGDGRLTAVEFSSALRRVNPGLNEAQIREYARHIDRDKGGAIPWAEFCDKLSVAAETCHAHTPGFLKGSRGRDHGDIIGNTDDDLRRRRDAPADVEFVSAASEIGTAQGLPQPLPAGRCSSDMMTKERTAFLFEEWDELNMQRRGRGSSVAQSSGLRFDDRGYQTNVVGRGAVPPAARERSLPQRGQQSFAVRDCLQPTGNVLSRPHVAAIAAAAPLGKERVLHMRSVSPRHRLRARLASRLVAAPPARNAPTHHLEHPVPPSRAPPRVLVTQPPPPPTHRANNALD
jgi:hypothetical protein